MRKFIIEIHPDGSLTCCEYEDPKDAAGDPRRKCPDCGCCCDYGSPCCDMDGGNIDHPNGCKKL